MPLPRTFAAIAAAVLLSLTPVAATGAQAATPTGLHVTHPHRHLEGRMGDLSYDVTYPVFGGSSAAATIDRRVRASAQATITSTAKEPGGGHHTLTGVSTVTPLDGRTVQVITEYADAYDGAAHPLDTVETVALVARTGKPITLATLFPKQHHAFTVLAKAVRGLATSAKQPITDPSGLAPRASNWAAWQSITAGFQISFQDYQLGGHGLRQYTVPWSVVTPLLSTRAKALIAPRS